MLRIALALCALAGVVPHSSALYFHMYQGDRKCFIEEVPEETIVQGKYKLELFDPQTNTYQQKPDLGITVKIKNPENEEIMDKLYKDSPGHFAFTSKVPGEHIICLSTESVWYGGQQLRVHLDIVMGEGTNDYEAIRQREKLDDLQLRIRQLTEQIDQISKEQSYQRVREARFRETSETTNWRVLYWSFIQLSILLVSGFWMIRHLKSFFVAKKLV
eukprot:comp10154_c0_seq1/m.4992 comp10154_c0_seq1/g.4992  ORF comp10154_c0_seq1/g.4992 comp10154_c0_seq1/m.4992 type:complete len:216 (-) comp10154_c0_seq1:149-796(-)